MSRCGWCWCSGGGICSLIVAAVLGLGPSWTAAEVPAGRAERAVPCAKHEHTAGHEAALSADEARVVDYVAGLIERGEAPIVSAEELQQRLGLSAEAVEALDEGRLRLAIRATLQKMGIDFGCATSNCSRYSACSVDRNLAFARGDELERYKAEVALDGRRFENWVAPDFRLPDTKGRTVSLADLRGRNVALVLLSGHCTHSLDTLPILADLRDKYAGQGITFVPVFVNSGGVETLASRAWEWDVSYPLVVAEDKSISLAYDSRMVPSTFLIDESGHIVRKFVGFKDRATLDEAVAELLGS